MFPLRKIWERIKRFFGGRGKEEAEKELSHDEWARKVLNEKIGIPKEHEKYPLLEKYLVMFLSGEDGKRALYRWSELLSSVIGKQVNKKLKEKENELKEERKEGKRRVTLDKAMSKAVKSGLLSLSDETAIKMLNRLRQDPSSFPELKSTMELNEGVRWRFDWLKSLNLVEPSLGEGEDAIYKLSKRGEKMLNEINGSLESQGSLKDQRHRLAEMAAGENTTADKLLNVLDGDWLESHRGDLEKIRKEYKDPLKEISKSFWLKREGGDPHLKHAGVHISDHEASGALLCLGLLSIHANDRGEYQGTQELFGDEPNAQG